MKFSLIFFMIFAAVPSFGSGSPGPISLLASIPSHLLKQCHQFFDRVKKFQNCHVPAMTPAEYTEEAHPYICLLTLNLIADICKGNSYKSWETFEAHHKALVNSTVCPFNYATIKNNLNIRVDIAINYFSNDENCKSVCTLNRHTKEDCIFMASLNDFVTTVNKKGEEVEVSLPREQNVPKAPNNVNHNNNTDNILAEGIHTKAKNPAPVYDETSNKTESKVTVKTETTSECENKEEEEKTSHAKVDAQSKISEHSKDIHTSNVHANINTNVINNDDIDKSNIKNNNNNNNNININNNENEAEEKISEDALNADKTDLTEPEIPPIKENSESSLYIQSSGRKDYPHNKALSSEIGDDDANEEISENAQLHDTLPDRGYDSARVPNPRELYNVDGLFQAEDSHFSAYFLMTVSIIIIGYIIYHNKNKIVAYALEGRRSRNGRRRPTSASYRKLDCNLEEAIASNPSHASVTNVVY